MERRDLYQDDLTEERYPSPATREDASATQVLDPDASGADAQQAGIPGGASASSAPAPDDDDEDDEEDDDDDEDDEEA